MGIFQEKLMTRIHGLFFCCLYHFKYYQDTICTTVKIDDTTIVEDIQNI